MVFNSSGVVHAQVVPDTLIQVQEVELDDDFTGQDIIKPDSTVESKAREFAIIPFSAPRITGQRIIESDSTLRWNQWLEFSELQSRRAGVITHRLGGFNRHDLMYIDGRRGSQQQLYVEGMLATDPVTGRSRFAHLPLERIAEIRESGNGLHQRLDAELLRFYTPKPITRITYQQSFYELRSTDALISRMLDRRTGLELVYHGKNNGGEYARMGTEGRQMSARYFRHIDERNLVQYMILYNGAEHMESGGYNIPVLDAFNFNRFFANPIHMNANSRERSLQIQAAWLRKNRDADRTTSRAIVYYDQYRRTYRTSADSSQYRWKSFNAAFTHSTQQSWLSTSTNLQARYYIPDHNEGYSLNHANWSELSARLNGQLMVPSGSTRLPVIPFSGSIIRRSDGFSGWEVVMGVDWSILSWVRLSADVSGGETLPTMQQRYWTGSVNGNRNLGTEPWKRVQGGLSVGNPEHGFHAQVQGHLTSHEQLHVLLANNTFSSVSNIKQRGGYIHLGYTSTHWEATASTTIQEYTSGNQRYATGKVMATSGNQWFATDIHSVVSDIHGVTSGMQGYATGNVMATSGNQWLATDIHGVVSDIHGVTSGMQGYATGKVMATTGIQELTTDNIMDPAYVLANGGTRLWNRFSLHRKGYVINRAAYVKAGVYGLFSPNNYRSPTYVPVADVWSEGSEAPIIPGFFRMDVDISARVRNLIVVIRMENITQGLGQNGYYETAPYPMPSRRMNFGLRVLFNN